MDHGDRHQAFTLVELLVVIGILGILLAITLIAINPARAFGLTNDSKRQSDVRQVHSALSQKIIDSRGVVPTYFYPLNTPHPIAKTGADICSLIVDGSYIAGLPTDPSLGSGQVTDCSSSYTTGYSVVADSRGNIGIFSDTGYAQIAAAGAVPPVFSTIVPTATPGSGGVTSSGTHTFSSNTVLGAATTYDSYDITINPGVTVTMHGDHTFASINNQGTIEITAYDGSANTGRLSIIANTVTSSGLIEGAGRGYGGGGGGGTNTYEAHAGAGGSAKAGAGGGGGGGTSSGWAGYCPNGGAAGSATEGGSSGSAGGGGCGVASFAGGGGGASSTSIAGGTSTLTHPGGGGGGGGGVYGGTGANSGASGNAGNDGGYLGTGVNGDSSTDSSAAIGSGGGGGSGCGVTTTAGSTGQGPNAGNGGGGKGANVSIFGGGGSGGGGGGSGGASLQLDTYVSITIIGTIRMNGGAGGASGGGSCPGGGGAGGGIVMNGPSVTFTGATIESLGKGLTSGGVTTNGGTFKVFTNSYSGNTLNTTNYPSGRVYTAAYIP